MWREDLFRSLILFLLPHEGTEDSGVSMPVENTVYQFTSNSALELRLSQGSNHTVLCENGPLIISPSNSWSGVRDSSTNYASMPIIILTLGRNDEKMGIKIISSWTSFEPTNLHIWVGGVQIRQLLALSTSRGTY